jgi:hypothetical protein
MSYEKYHSSIVRQHYIRIHGWPTEIPFNIPKITSSSDLRYIRQGLEQGSIRWVKLSREEIKELNSTYLEDRNEIRKRKRASKVKNRSTKKTKQRHTAKSAAYVESSTEGRDSSASDSNN